MITAVVSGSWKVWVVKMDGRGRITLPMDVRDRLRVRPGDTLIMHEVKGGLRIEPIGRTKDEASRTGHTAVDAPTDD
jgi:AbrB family looped-hinge helix DNA binding protein